MKVEWLHDGKRLLPTTGQSETIQLEDANTFEIRLNFNTPFTSDSGKYSCKLSNAKGSVTSKTMTIKVLDTSKVDQLDESLFQSKPRFIEYFSDVYMEANGEAQFKCKIIGKPEPKVVWSCNCSKITANDKFELVHTDEEHYTFIVRGVNADDEQSIRARRVMLRVKRHGVRTCI